MPVFNADKRERHRLSWESSRELMIFQNGELWGVTQSIGVMLRTILIWTATAGRLLEEHGPGSKTPVVTLYLLNFACSLLKF